MRRLLATTGLAVLALTSLAGADPVRPTSVLTAPAVDVPAGGTALVPVSLRVAPVTRKVDVMVLLDRSSSMTRALPGLTRELAAAVQDLARTSTDLRVGLALAGTSPAPEPGPGPYDSDTGDDNHADPLVDPSQPAYRPPVLFRRTLPLSTPALFGPVVRAVTPELLAFDSNGLQSVNWYRQQSQLLGLDQLLTGKGYQGSTSDDLLDRVQRSQVFGWRSDPTVTRYVVDVTDDVFGNPPGTPRLANRVPDVAGVGARLKAQRVHHVGLVVKGFRDAVKQQSMLSTATATILAKPLACAGETGDQVLPAGAPIVCTASRARAAIATAVLQPMRPARLEIAATAGDPVFIGLSGERTTTVDAFRTMAVTAQVGVSCPLSKTPSVHTIPVSGAFDGAQVATGAVTVRCGIGLTPPPDTVTPTVPGAVVQMNGNPPPPANPPAQGNPAPNVVVQPGPAVQTQVRTQPQLQVALRPEPQPEVQLVDQEVHAVRHAMPPWLWLGCLTVAAAGALVVRRVETVVQTGEESA